FFSSRRRHTSCLSDWSSDVCSSDLGRVRGVVQHVGQHADPDRLLVSGNSLVDGLPRLLEVLADVLGNATYPADEVGTERDRLVDRIQVAQSQPAHLARVALLKRVYGDHPYAVQTPAAEEVKEVTPVQLLALHAERMHPDGAVLVLVGDIAPDAAIDQVET